MQTLTERTAWLAERRKGLGASDAAAVVGLSPWRSPLSVFLDKTGRLPTPPMTTQQKWGLLLEPVLAEAYAEETGRTVFEPSPNLRHPEYSWMLANLDRLTACGRVVELKTAGAFAGDEWGEPGTDQVPETYLVQVAHQMAVVDAAVADVAVLIGGQTFRIYTVERNDLLIDRIIRIEASFWQRVQRDEPPPIDWAHPQTPALIEAMHAPTGESITLDEECLELAREFLRLGEETGQAQEARSILKARLLDRMAGASLGLLPDGSRITRKKVARKGYQVEPCEYHTFTIKQPRTSEES